MPGNNGWGMVSDDPNQQLMNAVESLKESHENGEITTADYEAIKSLIDEERGEVKTGQKGAYTVRNHARTLKLWAKRHDGELTNPDIDAISDTLTAFRIGSHPDVKDEGIGVTNYQSALRVFYKYHDDLGIDPDEHDSEGDVLKCDPIKGRRLTPDDLLYQQEVDDLLGACQRNNIRDMAFVATVLATCQRLDAVRTLRLKHVEDNGETMDIMLNEQEAQLKGTDGSRPVLWAKHYLRPWYKHHPHKGNPEAALFCPTEGNNRVKSEDKDPTDPISGEAIRSNLRRRAEEAGIEKNVYPHLLRHCGITRLAAEGLSEQQIKDIAGWDGDSSQFDTYVNLKKKLSNNSIRESLGLPTDEDIPVVGRPTWERCPNCNDRLPEGGESCLTCGEVLTHRELIDETERKEQEQDDIEIVLDKVGDDPDKALEVIDSIREQIADTD